MILTYLLRSWFRESTWPVRGGGGGGANVHGGWLRWLSTLNGHFTPVCICSQPNIRPIAGVNYTETLKFTAKAFMIVLAQPTAKLVLSYLTDPNYETDSTRAQSALTPMWYKLHSNCNSIPQSISSWDIANISMTRQTVLPQEGQPANGRAHGRSHAIWVQMDTAEVSQMGSVHQAAAAHNSLQMGIHGSIRCRRSQERVREST